MLLLTKYLQYMRVVYLAYKVTKLGNVVAICGDGGLKIEGVSVCGSWWKSLFRGNQCIENILFDEIQISLVIL